MMTVRTVEAYAVACSLPKLVDAKGLKAASEVLSVQMGTIQSALSLGKCRASLERRAKEILDEEFYGRRGETAKAEHQPDKG